jgi:hypothetical protein
MTVSESARAVRDPDASDDHGGTGMGQVSTLVADSFAVADSTLVVGTATTERPRPEAAPPAPALGAELRSSLLLLALLVLVVAGTPLIVMLITLAGRL